MLAKLGSQSRVNLRAMGAAPLDVAMILKPPTKTAIRVAYGSHSAFTIAAPRMSRADGMYTPLMFSFENAGFLFVELEPIGPTHNGFEKTPTPYCSTRKRKRLNRHDE